MVQEMFHQKQYKNYCRCHAINNFLGKQIISYEEFDNMCDKFDINSNMPLISKKEFYFYHNDNNDNIFSFIFKHLGYNFKLTTFINYKNNSIKYDENIKGFIVFNNHHTWCIRKKENNYYIIDSLSWMIKKLNEKELNNYLSKMRGVISIF